ncbi:MAG: RNA-binding S4 domain-containing protein [Clostridiales bacterium]|nr:RNA-binding S4 domain-containing protein [Clostridiales bacterium]MCF8021514.1 RNA-binding S4 domain-containing protein [Clostridiales bacterium]
MYKEVIINNEIKLDQFLKWINIADTGGMAKEIIKEGNVIVNNVIETKRGKKLSHGDLVVIYENEYKVLKDN